MVIASSEDFNLKEFVEIPTRKHGGKQVSMCGIRLEFEDMRMEIEFEMSLISIFS